MDSLRHSLLRFFVAFIASHTSETQVSNLLVKRMMKLKDVQRTIIDCMYKLESTVTAELGKLKNSSSEKHLKDSSKQSNLLKLAIDVRNLMNNFEDIHSKLDSVNKIVDTLDKTIESETIIEDSQTFRERSSPLMEFLSSMSRKPILTNHEFEEISSNTWSSHTEVENILKVELLAFSTRLNQIESKYHYKLFSTKLKTGQKILSLENQLKTQDDFYLKLINQLKMTMEDSLSQSYERNYYETKIIQENLDYMPVADLLSAIQKIKYLTAAKTILEKSKVQDEKVIKGLSNKMQVTIEKFTEAQELSLKINKNNSSLSWCLGKLIEKSNLDPSEKSEFLNLLINQSCEKIEDKFKVEGFLEKYSINSISKKFEELKDGVMTLSYAIKNDAVKQRLTRLLDESQIAEAVRLSQTTQSSSQKLKNPLLKRPLNIRPLGSQATASTLHTPDIHLVTESPLDHLKKVFINIDEELKNKSRKINEEIEGFASTLKDGYKSQKVENKLLGKAILKNLIKSANLHDASSQTDVNIVDSEGQTDYYQRADAETQANRPLPGLSNLLRSHMAVDLSHVEVQTELKLWKEIGLQTEKVTKIKEFTNPKKLVRGLMRKSTAPASKTVKLLKKHEILSPHEDFILSKLSTEAAPLVETGLISTSTLELTQDHIDEIKDASSEYSKEFKIQSQLYGYKKLTFNEIQTLWEEVINRRITEGEVDKISLFLRGYLGTDQYEIKKGKVIEMLNKKSFEKFNQKGLRFLMKEVREEKKAVINWRNLMEKVIGRLAEDFAEGIRGMSGKEALFTAAGLLRIIQNCRGIGLKKESGVKSEISLVYKSDLWRNRSNSPVMVGKKIIKSKFMAVNQNLTTDRVFRTRTPKKLIKRPELSKLPFLYASSK